MKTGRSPSDAAETRPARILVADDDRLTRDALAAILRGAGHLVEAVEDGQTAVERGSRGNFDLVLLDVVMPRMSGVEACRILKSATSGTFLPIVLVTVKTDTTSRVEGLRIGADDYVCKPFDEEELLARVSAMLRIKRLADDVVAQRARLESLIVIDEMTGLYNFRYLNTRLTEEFKRAERYHEPFACALIDIDHLKLLNEVSREVGDAVIRSVADALRRCVRDVDVVARYGGEEFLVILPSTHFAGSASVGERIWREVRDQAVDVDGRSYRVTVSVGIALYPSRDIRTKDALLRGADAALEHAKREGGSRICIFQQHGYFYSPALAPEPQQSRLGAESKRGQALADAISSGPSSVRFDTPPEGRKP